MASEESTQISNTDSVDENERASLDYISIDTDVDEISSHHKSLMPDPYTGEEFSDESISKAMEQFVLEFTNRYSTSGPPLFIGSLEQALTNSLYNSTNPCPLILFLYHNDSTAANIFCERVLCTDRITEYLTNHFIVWAWDRTNEINDERFLTMLGTDLNDEVVATVVSLPMDKYPVLISLVFDKGQVEIVNVIEGVVTNDEAFALLKRAHDRFEQRIETPDPINLSLRPVANEDWTISPSVLTPIERISEEFTRISNEFIGHDKRAVSIYRIENSSWLVQYLNQKKLVYSHCNDDQSEQLLVFPCSQTSAEHILQNGFNNDHKCIPEKKYGHGFYFLSPSVYKNRYPSSNSANNGLKTILVCRVLVGRTCLGNWMIESCPNDYDSTTDGSNTYIVYSNRSILPAYYIKY